MSKRYHSPSCFLIITAVSILIAEAFVMLLICFVLPPFSPLVQMLIDCILLVLLIYPVLYFFSFRPLIMHIVERERAEEALSWESRVNTSVAELSRALIRPVSIDEISSLVLEHAKDLTGSKFGSVGYIDPETGYLIGATMTKDIWDICEIPNKTNVFKEFTGLWGWVLINREPMFTNSPAEDPRSSGTPEGHIPIDRFLSVPGMIGETLVGQVMLANSDRDYTERDLEVVGRLASLYALAVQRKRAEEVRMHLATAVDQAAEMIVITDTEGKIHYINPAFEKITGYKREEVIGKSSSVLKSDSYDAAFYKEMWDALRRGETWKGHLINKKKDGALYEEEATISPVRNASGEIVNYVAVKRDITREVMLERQLLQSQKMESIGNLAAGIAHDLNNMLTPILGYVQLVRMQIDKGIYSPDHLFKRLDTIISSANRAKELVEQLLNFSRQGKHKPRDLDINVVVREATKLLRKGFSSTALYGLDCKSCATEYIHADETQIHQVIQNLAMNARDAMPSGGTVTITTRDETTEGFVGRYDRVPPGSYVKLSVSDTGTGISENVLTRMFEPFFTTKEKGTGLGLSNVWGITRNHHAYIDVKTEIGEGTTFDLYFPTIVRREVEKSAEEGVSATGGGTILVVDDEEEIRELAYDYLRDQGYDVVIASNGGEALEVYRKGSVDVVLADLIMRPMDGIRLAEKIREIDPGAKIYVMSGSAQDEEIEQLLESENVSFVKKPFNLQELRNTINSALIEKQNYQLRQLM